MPMFRTELFSRPAPVRDGSSAMSRRPRRYGVSTARQTKLVLTVVDRLMPQPAINQEELTVLNRAA